MSTYLQLDCLYLKKQIYSETFLLPYPPCKITVNFDKSPIFSHLVLLFLCFLCVKLQYLVSTYLQLDCLYLKKQIYSETFCYPTPHVKLQSILTKVQFFSHLVLLFLQKRFLCVTLQYLVSTYLQLDCLYLKKQIYSETFCYPTLHVKLQSILTKVQFFHI